MLDNFQEDVAALCKSHAAGNLLRLRGFALNAMQNASGSLLDPWIHTRVDPLPNLRLIVRLTCWTHDRCQIAMSPRVFKESDLSSINLLVSGLHDVVPHALVEALRERSDVALVTDEVIDEKDLEDYLRKAPHPDVLIQSYRGCPPSVKPLLSQNPRLVIAQLDVEADEVDMILKNLTLDSLASSLVALVRSRCSRQVPSERAVVVEENQPSEERSSCASQADHSYEPEPLGRATFEWIDAALDLYRLRHSPAAGDVPGYAVGSAAVEEALRGWPEEGASSSALCAERRLKKATIRLNRQLESSEERVSRLVVLKRRLSLSFLEFRALLLALAPEIDPRYQLVFGALNNDLGRRGPSFGLICGILGVPLETRRALLRNAHLLKWRLLGSTPFVADAETQIALDPSILGWLFGQPHALRDDGSVRYLLHAEPWCKARWATSDSDASLRSRLLDVLDSSGPAQPGAVLYGPEPDALCCMVESVAGELRKPLLRMSLAVLAGLDAADFDETLIRFCRMALLEDSVVVVDAFVGESAAANSERLGRLLEALQAAHITTIVVVESLEGIITHLPDGPFVLMGSEGQADRTGDFVFAAERAGYELSREQARELAAIFPLARDQIIAAIRLAAAEVKDIAMSAPFERLRTACRKIACVTLPRFARRLQSTYRLGDVVLPPSQHQQLREMVTHVQRARLVMHDWGFASRLPGGTGIAALFAGPSGTGKTMAAQAIANELGTDAFQVDLSRVVSKYIGETEKNLNAVFDDAERSGAVLIFDEADALFGKRSETRDAHDRYANIEVAFLLQRMEAFSGVAILTTNYRQNLDTAFNRRIRFMLDFPRPDAEARKQIWRYCIPPETPVAPDIPWKTLARVFDITGGTIRQICLRAAFLASWAEPAVLRIEHILQAARAEFQKPGMAEALRSLDVNEATLRQPMRQAAA